MTRSQLESGSDPRIARAEEFVRKMPLRWSECDNGRPRDAVLNGGWFDGAGECARILMAVAPLESIDGCGFGGTWPLLSLAGTTMAPGMPLAVRKGEQVSVDGSYRSGDRGIWREAVGAKELFLSTGGSRTTPGRPFDLLWFGEAERFIVRAGVLEIEDLFGRLSVSATAGVLDRVLVRAKRLDAAILSSLTDGSSATPQTIEVRRPASFHTGEFWSNPTIFLGARPDISSARLRGDTVEVRTASGTVVEFHFEWFSTGWELSLSGGTYNFVKFRAVREDSILRLQAVLNDQFDAMQHGMRGRLIFDLRSDLVGLG